MKLLSAQFSPVSRHILSMHITIEFTYMRIKIPICEEWYKHYLHVAYTNTYCLHTILQYCTIKSKKEDTMRRRRKQRSV